MRLPDSSPRQVHPDGQAMPAPKAPPANPPRTLVPARAASFLGHLGCALLVLLFVHLYEVYRLVGNLFGQRFLTLAPLLLPPLLLTVVFFASKRLAGATPKKSPPIFLGLLLCLAALAIPDPEITVKRIHVAQYLLLSLVIRATLAARAHGGQLTLSATLLACLYGVHDELLQGLHPDRTYGLRDMLVNALAAAGGGLVWHGLALFERPASSKEAPIPWPWWQRLAPPALLITVAMMAVPLFAYRHHHLPIWPFLPLAALLVLWGFLFLEGGWGKNHLLLPPAILALLFFLYPLAVNALQIPFY